MKLTPLAQEVLNGNTRAIARAITQIENDHPDREALIDSLYSYSGNAMVLGLTGPPGSGKSTLLNLMIRRERAQGKKVAVIAVDPSSPFSGGAILGDRLRMQRHSTDEGVFIRSMASRGHLGGVAGATGDVIKVLDAAGFDIIIIETIGVGQTEIDIVEMADVVLLVLVPGLGDEIQALKAGVMEIGDIFIINKSDRDDAAKVKAEVEYVLHLKMSAENTGTNPIVMTSALEESGLEELQETIHTYYQSLKSGGRLEEKRKKRIAREMKLILLAKVRDHVNQEMDLDRHISEWVEAAYQKQVKPYAFINEKLNAFFAGGV
jgi:LAO/AO transport system kinase